MKFTERPAPRRLRRRLLLAATAPIVLLTITLQGRTNPTALGSLKTVPPPRPSDLTQIVADEQALVVLGKAFFWDTQVGSDGRTACATCHFHAGADHRRQNTVVNADELANYPANKALTAGDFPFHQLANPLDAKSAVLRDQRAIVGSTGVVERGFLDVTVGDRLDAALDDNGQRRAVLGGLKIRQVTARNAPSIINAVFNVRNFWDGRASANFTGATPFGDSDTATNVIVADGTNIGPSKIKVDHSSLASQAVGPPLNGTMMSWAGRSWSKLGKKMFSLAPLARQNVAVDDSVLGSLANPNAAGLLPGTTYSALVRTAFKPLLWQSTIVIDADGRLLTLSGTPRNSDEFTQMEANFAVFWGLAIQAYESTLIANDSRFDRYMEGVSITVLSSTERYGLTTFQGLGRCSQCHSGPELSAAATISVTARDVSQPPPAEFGFFRTGVSRLNDDLGAGGKDGFGLPLFPTVGGGAANGTFKVPQLRNVDLTGPYFHNGGQATLGQVLEFYSRHGDFPEGGVGAAINDIRLSTAQRDALAAFLKSLTDERVSHEKAPFDHPALCVPVGYSVSATGTPTRDELYPVSASIAQDSWALVPAIGKNGSTATLQTFEELLAGVGVDGSRTHTLTQSCVP